jgi:hypothetical protein
MASMFALDWSSRCSCKDALVVGHSAIFVKRSAYHLVLRGTDRFNGRPCERKLIVGLETFIDHRDGDSIHFEREPFE